MVLSSMPRSSCLQDAQPFVAQRQHPLERRREAGRRASRSAPGRLRPAAGRRGRSAPRTVFAPGRVPARLRRRGEVQQVVADGQPRPRLPGHVVVRLRCLQAPLAPARWRERNPGATAATPCGPAAALSTKPTLPPDATCADYRIHARRALLGVRVVARGFLQRRYMLRRYWPPTSNSAVVIWPSEQHTHRRPSAPRRRCGHRSPPAQALQHGRRLICMADVEIVQPCQLRLLFVLGGARQFDVRRAPGRHAGCGRC